MATVPSSSRGRMGTSRPVKPLPEPSPAPVVTISLGDTCVFGLPPGRLSITVGETGLAP